MSRLPGGAAFPCNNDADKTYEWVYKGMSFLDYCAVSALPAVIASNGGRTDAKGCSDIAKTAYMIADAMIEERLTLQELDILDGDDGDEH